MQYLLICKFVCLFIERCICFCFPLYKIFSKKRCMNYINFICGCLLGQAYYYYLLTRIPLPYNIGVTLSIILSIILGICNAVAIQIRCISLLLFPMYCGKAGRGVLKVIVLTYVVAGPIINMGKNAREVVRVFSCCTQLSYNLSEKEHSLLIEPIRKTALSVRTEMEELKETFRVINNIIAPIQSEMEGFEEIQMDMADLEKIFFIEISSRQINGKLLFEHPYTISSRLHYNKKFYQNLYQKKLTQRCEIQLKQMHTVCKEVFEKAYNRCLEVLRPKVDAWILCWPIRLEHVCDIINFIPRNLTCNGSMQIGPGLGEGYLALKEVKDELTSNIQDLQLQYKVTYEQDLYDIQDAKETGERVMHAFDEKTTLMSAVFVVLNLYVGIIILRIPVAAIYYHDKYLLSIEYDNVYITKYFKLLDKRREERHEMTLLPLKKMERNKYIDVYSKSQKVIDHSKLVTQILKVLLEVVTATTFVMLDRLFYEALDVVRQHAQTDLQPAADDIKIQVEGTGMLASLFRKLLSGFSLKSAVYNTATNEECLPHPRAMPTYYYFKIYGGYLWILLLLCIDPYTVRLRRLICSYFYPGREKRRILHLYNDILKKRMKMPKTLRRKAIQAVRAYYLSGENLLSLRIKFPLTLGWLRILPAARMTCLICNETEPRIYNSGMQRWYSCGLSKCPFVYCSECWRETGARCLACDPSLAELSDIDSLSEDEHPRY